MSDQAVVEVSAPPDETSMSAADDPVVRSMFGPYRLEELIGRGGMGEVYRAFDTVRGRVVALKKLPTALAADPVFQARFRAEAALAARLHEPHVIPVHDFGEIDGQLYLDMRLVEGPDLAALLRDDGPLPPHRVVDIVTQVAAALDAAHTAGLVHRDIKPGNILLVRSGAESDFAYVADFGIARAVDGSSSVSLTATGATVGSLDYLAPERFGTGRGDHRVDVYALGCVLYEALTAMRPFPVDGWPAMINAHLNTPPPAPSARRPEVPPGLDDVVARAMAKEPDDRYPTAGALAVAARRALDGGAATNPPSPVPPLSVPSSVRPSSPPPGPGRGHAPRRRRTAVLAASAVVIGVLAAVIATQLVRSPEAAAQVVMEPVAARGVNPFMPSVAAGPSTVVTSTAGGGPTGTVSGATAGLYGGTLNDAACDPARMVTFLQSHPDKAQAWADVEGIQASDVPTYVRGLTPVVLRADTAVTNHGFADGRATTLRSVLQSGTAVLVDPFGVPRARCYCGNPLTPPSPLTAADYTGERWSGFNPAKVVTVEPAPAPISQLNLIDTTSHRGFSRPVGGDGRSDRPRPAADPTPSTDAPAQLGTEEPAPTTGATAPPTPGEAALPTTDTPVTVEPSISADPPPESGPPGPTGAGDTPPVDATDGPDDDHPSGETTAGGTTSEAATSGDGAA